MLNNLEQYKAATGSYPDRLDNLLNTNGDAYAALYSDGQFRYGSIGTGNFLWYSMTNGAGMSQVAVQDETRTNFSGDPVFEDDPNNASIPQDIGPTTQFCIVDPAAAAGPWASKARRMVLTAYPNQADPNDPGVPSGHTLIALGIGHINSAVGSTMTQAPLCPEKSGSDQDDYDRFIGLFDIGPGGSNGRGSMNLRAVVDSEFNTVAKNLEYYEESGPSDLGSTN